MDSKQNEYRHFRAQRVFISSLPRCFCVGYQTETGPPSPKTLQVHGKGGGTAEQTQFSFLLEGFLLS